MSTTELPDLLIDTNTKMTITTTTTQSTADQMGVTLAELKGKIVLLAIVDETNISDAVPGKTVMFAPLKTVAKKNKSVPAKRKIGDEGEDEPASSTKMYENIPAKGKRKREVVAEDEDEGEDECGHCRKVRPKEEHDDCVGGLVEYDTV